jgi:serine phosphatase RsbU (regulator of sigma subunit)
MAGSTVAFGRRRKAGPDVQITEIDWVARASHLLPSGPVSRVALIRWWVTRTFSGRAIAGGALIKLLAYLLGLTIGRSPTIELIDTAGDIILCVGVLVLGFRLFVDLKQRLLWRVRRKLTLSYIFIGFVPALLIILFFLVSGLLLFFNIASYMTRNHVAEIIDETRFFADAAALELQRAGGTADAADALERRYEAVSSRYGAASFAVVPTAKACGSRATSPTLPQMPITRGRWAHAPPPTHVPDWVPCTGYADIVTFTDADRTKVATRSAVFVDGSAHAVIVDIPLGEQFAEELRTDVGIELGDVIALDPSDRADAGADPDPPPPGAKPRLALGAANIELSEDAQGGLNWVTFIDHADWATGNTSTVLLSFRMGQPLAIYNRISVSSATRVGEFDFGQALLILLASVGGLFLVIQAVAFGMGLALARSITGSVHELFAGTERVRRGDFTGRIAIRSRDQLGDLAESFNSMTSSIEDLLQQKAEKERLEQELRIARSIQMSLLPQGPLSIPGISVTAHCEPAREVGGDYYDFLPINEHTLGILVADVSGKGTSAALYMAELKGIVLSLSQRHISPRELLIEADRIISRHLDSRSFITVTYIVIDLATGLLRYARAGHCPLIHVPGPYASSRAPRLITPDGLVLGLQLDGGRQTFTRLLEEVTLPLGPGDLFLLYTDGISEAMNPQGECFGDARLADLVGAHADLGADELRERILREITTFAGTAPQHDDMTMALVRVEAVGGPVGAAAARVDASRMH